MVKKDTGWFVTNTYDVVLYCTPPIYSGCYAIYLLDHIEHSKKLLYIGTAQNLKQRLSSHEILRTLDYFRSPNEIPYIKIKLISNKETRMLTEKKLINRLLPPLNKVLYYER